MWSLHGDAVGFRGNRLHPHPQPAPPPFSLSFSLCLSLTIPHSLLEAGLQRAHQTTCLCVSTIIFNAQTQQPILKILPSSKVTRPHLD